MGVPLRGRNLSNRNKSNKINVVILQPFRLFGLARGPAPTAGVYVAAHCLYTMEVFGNFFPHLGGGDTHPVEWIALAEGGN